MFDILIYYINNSNDLSKYFIYNTFDYDYCLWIYSVFISIKQKTPKKC